MRRLSLVLSLLACGGVVAAPVAQAAPTAKTRTVCKKRTVRTASGKRKAVKRCWKVKVRSKAADPTPAPPAAPAAPAPAPAPDGIRGELRECANRERAKVGLGPLRDNPVLDLAAQAHVLDMKTRGYFSHDTPGGKSPFERIDELFGGTAPFAYMGENIAKGFDDAASTCQAWMDSPGHRANILRREFDSIGTGWVDGYGAQEFGGGSIL